MPTSKTGSTLRVPKMRLHKASGQAIVTLAGRDVYLGRWSDREKHEHYRRAIAEWMAAGCPRQPLRLASGSALTIEQLADAYEAELLAKAESPCVRERIELSLRPLRSLYGAMPAAEFGPKKLKAVRAQWIRDGISRAVVNERSQRLRKLFRWAVAEELLPANIAHGLGAVDGLRRGEEGVKEGRRVLPVAWEHVEETLAHVSGEVAALALLQWWCGARGGELCAMRPRDIDRSGEVWLFAPEHHKTAHHGKKREIQFGPRAQEVLKPFLDRIPLPDPEQPVFSPERAAHVRAIELGRTRQTRVQPSQSARKATRQLRHKAGLRQRPPGAAYDANTYARAIRRGVEAANKLRVAATICDAVTPKLVAAERLRLLRRLKNIRVNPKEPDLAKAIAWVLKKSADADKSETRQAELTSLTLAALRSAELIPHWHPHQLRHAAATRLRKEHGLEAARVVLGHAGAAVTELYAEIDHEKARRVAQVSG
jgi:integrase